MPAVLERVVEVEALDALGSTPAGLSSAEAEARLARHGPNRLPKLRRRSPLLRLLAQFGDFFAVLLEVAGAITLAIALAQQDAQNLKVALAIFAVVILNAAIGFTQEFRAERTAEALQRMLPARARVLRDGRPEEIAAEALVPGDIVLLSEGDAISADGRLIQTAELATNDAALTGESEPVRRQVAPVLETVPRIQARNLVFAGTSVASGTGRAVVTAPAPTRSSVTSTSWPAPWRMRPARSSAKSGSRRAGSPWWPSYWACCCWGCDCSLRRRSWMRSSTRSA
jgi:Ca2+-transporting ATPase